MEIARSGQPIPNGPHHVGTVTIHKTDQSYDIGRPVDQDHGLFKPVRFRHSRPQRPEATKVEWCFGQFSGTAQWLWHVGESFPGRGHARQAVECWTEDGLDYHGIEGEAEIAIEPFCCRRARSSTTTTASSAPPSRPDRQQSSAVP